MRTTVTSCVLDADLAISPNRMSSRASYARSLQLISLPFASCRNQEPMDHLCRIMPPQIPLPRQLKCKKQWLHSTKASVKHQSSREWRAKGRRICRIQGRIRKGNEVWSYDTKLCVFLHTTYALSVHAGNISDLWCLSLWLRTKVEAEWGEHKWLLPCSDPSNVYNQPPRITHYTTLHPIRTLVCRRFNSFDSTSLDCINASNYSTT